MQAHQPVDPDELRLSHIKSMGILLDCLTQRGDQPIIAAKIDGILPSSGRNLIEGFPNELFCFIGCYLIFCAQQGERAAEKHFDPRNPPLHYRYLRSIVAYLRQWQPEYGGNPRDAHDFYIIFKSMDLIGVEEDYGGKWR